MDNLLLVIVPIFGLIALGYATTRTKFLSQASADGVTAFVFGVATPVLLFRTLATAEFGGANPLTLWAVYFLGVAATCGSGMAIARRFAGADRRTSVIAGVAASFSNLVLVSIPVTQRVLGREGLDVLALLIAIHLPVMVGASTLMVERAAMRDARDGLVEGGFSIRAALGRIWRSLSRNTLIIGILLGLAFRLTGLPLAGPGAEIVDAVAGTAGPLALIVLGMTLPRYRLAGALGLPAALAGLALTLQPAVVFLVGSAVLPPLWLSVATLAAAAPSGVNAYLIAVYFKTGEQVAAATTVLSTVTAVATLSVWLLVLGV